MGERRKRKSMWHVEDDNSHPGDDNSWPTWPEKERNSTNNRERDHEFHGPREDDNRHPGDDNSWAAWPNKERHSINNRERDHEFRGPREDDNRRPGDDNSWPAWPDKERHSINNREHDQEFRGSRDFMDPKCRDRLGPQSRELKEENRYGQNMSSGFGDIERRKYKHDPEEGRSNSHRYSRRDMSRSRSRSRSPRSRARSGSPRQDYKNQSHKWSDQRSEHKQFQICRDFSSGRCRKGSQCRFEHSRNTSRGRSSDLRDDAPNYHNREEGKFLKKSRDAVPCREFVKGWCKWGDSCRFSHHLASNETEDVSNPGDSRNSRYDNRSYLSIENEGTNWKTRELGDTGMSGSIDNENIANKQENNDVSHDIPRQNEVENMSLHEQHSMHDHGVVENGGSDVLDEVNKSSNPTHLFQGSENILVPEQYSVSNETDVWQDMVSGGLDGLEAQAGAQLDLHSQVLNHELETQSGARLDLSSQVTNHQFETQSGTHSDLHSQLKNHQFETQLGAHSDLHSQANNPQFETQSGSHLNLQTQVPNRQLAVQILTGLLESKVTFPTGFPQELINPVEDSPVTKEHGNYAEQYNQVQVKQISPVSTVNKGPDNRKVDDFETSNRKQEAPLANLEADVDNKPIGEECKGVENTKKAEANVASKDEKAMRVFKNSLIEFVKDILKPTWKEGRLSREVHKTIVKKVVDKITSTVQPDHVPKTPDKVDQYLTFSKPKIAKLVQAYVDRFQKMES